MRAGATRVAGAEMTASKAPAGSEAAGTSMAATACPSSTVTGTPDEDEDQILRPEASTSAMATRKIDLDDDGDGASGGAISSSMRTVRVAGAIRTEGRAPRSTAAGR